MKDHYEYKKEKIFIFQVQSPSPEALPENQVAGNPGMNPVDYEEALELTGRGGLSYLSLAACSFIFMHSLIEMTAMAYIITPAECDLHLSVKQKSMINSAIFIGIVSTAICWGTLSDHFGRRKVMLPAVIGAVISSFASSLCTGFLSMFLWRLLAGVMVSASCATVLVYLGELQTNAYRNTAISIVITAQQVSFVLLPGLAWAVIPGAWSFNMFGFVNIRPWRVFMWTWSLVGFVGATLLFLLPESPSFVLASKGPSACLPILAKMYATNLKKKTTDYPVTSLITGASVKTKPSIKQVLKDMSELVKPPMRRCFYITHFCMFLVYLTANGLYLWLPDFVNELLRNTSLHHSMCGLIQSKYVVMGQSGHHYMSDDNKSKGYTALHGGGGGCSEGHVNLFVYPTVMLIELLFLVPFVTVDFIIDKVNKGILYSSIMATASVGLFACTVVPQIGAATFFMAVGLCTGSCASVLSALAVDAFPTSLRALAMCTMFMMGQLGAVVGTSLIGFMSGIWCHVVFTMVSTMIILSSCMIVFLWPNIEEVKQKMEAKNFIY